MTSKCAVILPIVLLAWFSAYGGETNESEFSSEQIAAWIKQLEDADFDTRAKASVELTKAGPFARRALEEALANAGAESRTSIEALLARYAWEKTDHVDYLTLFPANTVAFFRIPCLETALVSERQIPGGKQWDNPQLDALKEFLAQNDGSTALLQKMVGRLKGQIAGAAWNFKIGPNGSADYALIAELPSENAGSVYKKILRDLQLAELEEKYNGGLFLRTVAGTHRTITLAGRHVIFGSNPESVLQIARAMVKPPADLLITAENFAKVKLQIKGNEDAYAIVNAKPLMADLKSSLTAMAMATGSSNTDALNSLDKMKTAWLGLTRVRKADRIGYRLFAAFEEPKPSEDAVAEIQDRNAVKERLRSALAKAPADAAVLFAHGGKQTATDGAKKKFAIPPMTRLMLLQYENSMKVLASDEFADAVGSFQCNPAYLVLGDAGEDTVAGFEVDAANASKYAALLESLLNAAALDASVKRKAVARQKGDKSEEKKELEHNAVEKSEVAGRTLYTESEKSLFIVNTERAKSRRRLSWAVRDSQIVTALSLDALKKRLDLDVARYDANAILESDLDEHALPYILIADANKSFNAAIKSKLAKILYARPGDGQARSILTPLLNEQIFFENLPPLTITFARPERGLYECKLRMPIPLYDFGLVWSQLCTLAGPADFTEVYRLRAEAGDADSQVWLGERFSSGRGEPKDPVEAFKWFRKAAEQGNASGQNWLGWAYECGEGVAKDPAEAINWYRKSAEQGFDDAQLRLGAMYYYGRGIPKDLVEAAKWFHKAAEQGSASGQYWMGWMHDYGEGVAKDGAESANWYRKAAEQGHANAQAALGNCYRSGFGVTKDFAEAMKWYHKAAAQRNLMAEHNLGMMYEYGQSVAKDSTAAVAWYRKSAEHGYADGQNTMGNCYYYGYEVTKDFMEAAKWYRKAADQEHSKAQRQLGRMYQNGEGVPKDLAEAAKWYHKAADHGDNESKFRLGQMYENGDGVEKDLVAARHWYTLAAEFGHAGATKRLEALKNNPESDGTNKGDDF